MLANHLLQILSQLIFLLQPARFDLLEAPSLPLFLEAPSLPLFLEAPSLPLSFFLDILVLAS